MWILPLAQHIFTVVYVSTHVGYEKGIILGNIHMLQAENLRKGEGIIQRRKGLNATNGMQDYFSISDQPSSVAAVQTKEKMGRCDCLDLGSWEQGLEIISV